MVIKITRVLRIFLNPAIISFQKKSPFTLNICMFIGDLYKKDEGWSFKTVLPEKISKA